MPRLGAHTGVLEGQAGPRREAHVHRKTWELLAQVLAKSMEARSTQVSTAAFLMTDGKCWMSQPATGRQSGM